MAETPRPVPDGPPRAPAELPKLRVPMLTITKGLFGGKIAKKLP